MKLGRLLRYGTMAFGMYRAYKGKGRGASYGRRGYGSSYGRRGRRNDIVGSVIRRFFR